MYGLMRWTIDNIFMIIWYTLCNNEYVCGEVKIKPNIKYNSDLYAHDLSLQSNIVDEVWD